MEQRKELLSIQLSDLLPSQRNVRHAPTQIEELAALIASQGLLHPLLVTEQVVGRGKARRIKFAVAAGERRRRALLLLQREGRLPKDHAVPCELVPPERALEVSVAENSAREPMHPADEFEAFKVLVDQGKGVEDIAARFGVSALTVQRRLKLAALSPKLIALYREDGINLDQLMALAIGADHAAQERAWFDAKPWNREPGALRRVLTEGEVRAGGNALARFVGIGAYEAAGGVVRRDLFDSEQAGWISDPPLLRRLAAEKLEGVAELVRAEGWAWVEARIEVESKDLQQFSRSDPTLRRLTADEQQALDEMKHREAELDAESDAMREGDGWSADEAERIDLEEQDIAARRAAIQLARQTWCAEDKALAGAIVTVSREGDVDIIRCLVRAADRKAVAKRERAERRPATSPARGHDDAARSNDAVRPVISEALKRRLTAHQSMAVQAALVANSHVALAVLTHAFVRRTLVESPLHERGAMQVQATPAIHALVAAADDMKGCKAFQVVQSAADAWRARLPAERSEWLGWLIGLTGAELVELIAVCAALTVNGLATAASARDAQAIAAALRLDMADWWEPTSAGFLNHVSKAQIVQALKEAGADANGGDLGTMKKDALVATAVTRLAGKRWLPAELRTP